MSKSFKERIYRDYYRLHVLPRKGPLTPKKLASAAKSFDLHFGEFLPEDKTSAILDVGCGSGSLVWWLQSRGFQQAAGIDLSPDQIEAGRSLSIANLHLESLPEHLERVGRDRYRLVFLRDVLEHLEPAEVLDFLDQVRTALAPGGHLVIQTPNGASPFFGRVLYGDFSHERAFTATSLSQILLLTGFEEFKFKPFEPRLPKLTWRSIRSPRSWRDLRRALAWKLVKRFYRFLIYAEIGEGDVIVTYNLIASARRGTTPPDPKD
jgi:2-polyprenyl-3-methyl-5-hydroxy-6-metoxy-1,4-benzoquinol methylase